MNSEDKNTVEVLRRNLILDRYELEELESNFESYREDISSLLEELHKYNEVNRELSQLSTRSARLNYENYETYMAVHSNSIKISGSRSALKIAGEKLSKDVVKEIDDLLDKYLMIKF